MKRFFKILLGGLGLALAAVALPSMIIPLKYRGRIFSPAAAPSERVAIVFGAGLRHDSTPTPILQDRVAAAVELYKLGKVEKLLLSGDNRFVEYNEPESMRQAALKLGVPDDALVLDYAGRRTYDTCYRAKAIFGVTRALLVTQEFHLPRALFLCDSFGIEATGVSADRAAGYLRRYAIIWTVREVAATTAAWWDVNIARPLPVLGDPLPIFPEE